jgi:rubredoxin
VKRLPKKPAPARFGRKLTAAQKERATHICVDCGYIYCDAKAFEQTDPDYQCPQCRAPKKRFARYDAVSGKKVGGTSQDLATLLTVSVGLLGVGILAYLGFTL